MATRPTVSVKISRHIYRQLRAIRRQAKDQKKRVPDLSEMVNEAVSTRMLYLIKLYAGDNAHQA